ENCHLRKLSHKRLRGSWTLLLGATADRLAKREITIEVTDAATAWLAEHGYEPEYGARPLRRLIQREVDDRIAELFVEGHLVDGGAVRVDAADGTLAVTALTREHAAAA